jgi:PAS domain S-box-containing protein
VDARPGQHEAAAGGAATVPGAGGRLPRAALPALTLALVVALAYALTAWLGLGLVARLEVVAVFWPAAGVAAGSMAATAAPLRPWLAAAVAGATLAVNLLAGNGPAVATVFALVNAAEGWLVALLLGRRLGGRPARLDRLDRVLALLLAAGVAAALAGLAGAAALHLLGHAQGPFGSVWRVWSASDLVGIVTVTPLILALAPGARRPLPARKRAEGVVLLLLLGAAAYVLGQPSGTGPWLAVAPVALLVPLLLAIAVRCAPVFAAAGSFVLALLTVWHTTRGIGRFADPAYALPDRVLAAQALMLSAALCDLALAALIAERRRSTAALAASEERFRLLARASSELVWEWDVERDRVVWGDNLAAVVGYPPERINPVCTASVGEAWARWDALIHPDDRGRAAAGYERAVARREPFWTEEYRFLRPDGYAWLLERDCLVYDEAGRLARIVGSLVDVTERKRAEADLVAGEVLRRELAERARRRLEAVVEGIAEAVVRCSRRRASGCATPPG